MTVARIWNGSSWVSPSGFNRPKIWNGSTWVVAQPRFWNGSNWGDNLSTGGYDLFVPGGKGTAAYSISVRGFTPGGIYQDYENYYALSYPAGGSFDGTISMSGTQRTVYEAAHFVFSAEDSSTGYNEYKLVVQISANVSGVSYTPYLDGSAIAGAKTGSWDGTRTVFTWLQGTLPNTGGTAIPGSDYSTPTSNPFGSVSSVHTFQML